MCECSCKTRLVVETEDFNRQEQRAITVFADKQLYKDMWQQYHAWLRQYQHIEGFYGLHVKMPLTPNCISQGVAKGRNALGLEDAGNRTLGGRHSN